MNLKHIYFFVAIDPTSLNKQGHDEGAGIHTAYFGKVVGAWKR